MPDKTVTDPTLADRIRAQAALSARPGQATELEQIAAEVEEQRTALDLAGQALSAYNEIALDVTGMRETLVEGEPVDWQGVWESVGDLGRQVWRLTRQRDSARAALAAIKAADPTLFDPEGGTNRGEAYERYGTRGHNLRAAYCAAVGIKLEDGDDE